MNDYSEKLKMKILDFDESKRQQWERERQPYGAIIELTSRCNLNCIHCYLQHHHDSNEMSFEKIIEIIDILYSKGVLFLTLTGGEIFTRKDFLNIYLYAKQKGFLVELFTNGTLLTDEMVSVFNKYPPLLVDVSIYGGCEETYKKVTGCLGVFEKVIGNCQKLNKANVRVSLKTPILKDTLSEIKDMKNIAEQLGVVFSYSYEITSTIDRDNVTKTHQISVCDMLRCEFMDYNPDINKAEINENAENSKNDLDVPIFTCKVAKSSFVIDYQGRMCPCMKFRHRGIILEKDNFDKIWEEFGKIPKIAASKTYKCASCEALYYCEVCPAEMESLYGDMEYRIDTACKFAKSRMAFYKEHVSIEEAVAISMK